jgi:hypothetical protein
MKSKTYKKLLAHKVIQTRVEKTFKRLMVEFLNFQLGKPLDSKEVLDKIDELHLRWKEYCDRIQVITPEGRNALKEHIVLAIEKLKAPLIPLAPEPLGTTAEKKLE